MKTRKLDADKLMKDIRERLSKRYSETHELKRDLEKIHHKHKIKHVSKAHSS